MRALSARVAPLLAALALWAPASAGAAGPAALASDGAMHVHVTAAGDTLIGLGQRFLVDPAQWTELQRLNQVRNPRRMPVGNSLRIPLQLMRTEPAPATVATVIGAVRSGAAPVVAGQTLAEGSEVATDADGLVTVRLVDGTVLRLRSGGRVRIDESRRVIGTGTTRSGVQLERGRVEIQAQPARGGQPGFRIGTPQGVLGVRGTEFRVESAGALTLSEVLEGAVAVTGSPGSVEQRLTAGFGTVIDAAGRVAPPTALLPPPDLSQLPAVMERPLVRLPMVAMAGAQAWRLQVGRDDRFDQLWADVRSITPELRVVGLADGRYPVRVRAVDAQGLEGRDASYTLILKARPEPPLPRAPAPRTVITGTAVELAWAASSEASRYRLQVARVDAGTALFTAPLHDLKALDGLTHTLDGLAPGAYAWRLASLRADGDQGPFGDVLTFDMRAPPPNAAPPGPPDVGDQSIRFFWQGLPGQRFDFQVAADDGFGRLVEQLTLDKTEIELPLPGAGRFYVRLRARDADGFVGPWSATQHFDVIPCVRDARGGCVRVEGGPLRLQ